MVAQTRKSNGGSAPSLPTRLTFSDKLVGKGLTTDALQKKLRALHTELAALDQETVETKTLTPVCRELVSTSILLHKDKGVKAYAACCLADLLRLFAPDAPYTGPELRDIFQFFFRQLALGLKGATEPYYNEYFHLLESLSTVKSVVLVCDLPQAEELMAQIFRDFFGLVRQELAKNIEMFMSDILIALIEESGVLPSEVLEALMAQFMDKNARMDQPAYRLAVEVCNATSDRLQRHVCQYFTDSIIASAEQEDYAEIARCHELIKRLNAACPAVLHNVIPQLEEELRVEDAELRVLATQVLGEMFAAGAGGAGAGGGELEKKYPATWALWLKRRNDKAPQVRLAFVEGCKGMLMHHRVELREAIEESLAMKLCDPDDKVRAATCKLYGSLDYETALHYVSEAQLRALGERIMDKKMVVRQEALASIGRLFSLAYPEIENNDAAAIKQFAWIPQQITLALSATLDVKVTSLPEISKHILPLPSKGDDEAAWTDRLLTIMQYLDEKGVKALLSIANLKMAQPSAYEVFVQCCIENNGGVIDENEDLVKRRLAGMIRTVAALYSDPQNLSPKVADDLSTFAKMNEQRLYKLLKTCMDPQTDLKGLVKAYNEFTRRVEQSSPSILGTMTQFVRLSGLWVLNQSSVPTLVKRLQKTEKGKGKGKAGDTNASRIADSAELLLGAISKSRPAVHRAHVSEFAKAIADEKNPRLVGVCLRAIAAVSRQEPGFAPSDKRTIERLVRFVRGSEPKHAKLAARVLAFTKNKEELCSETVEFIADDLPKADPETLVARIAVLKEMVRFAPDAFEQKSDVIIEFLLKETLMRSSSPNSVAMDVDEDAEEWVEEDELPPLAKAKILALKVCRHRCLVHAGDESAVEIATPVLKMFATLLDNGGALSEDAVDDPTVKSRLRLQAAWSLTCLSTSAKFYEAITPSFLILALTIQDPCYQVRQAFLNKLVNPIQMRSLPPRFNVIPFLTVHDPEEEIKTKARALTMIQLRRGTPEIRLNFWEMPLVRLLHIVAHHPDFGLDASHILESAKYIREYLNCVATADNISLLYNLAQRCKTVRDAESHLHSEQLYATSEMAQELIKNHCKVRQWSLPSHPGKVKLPVELFRPLPSEIARSSILKAEYLSEELVKKLEEGSASHAKDKPKPERNAAAKRKATTGTNGTVKRARGPNKRRKHYSSEDEDDGEDDEDPVEEYDGDENPKMSSPRRSAPVQSDEEEEEESGSDKDAKANDLGRGARTRAKAKAQKKTRRRSKTKPASDEE